MSAIILISCTITPDDTFLLAGTQNGDVKLFNLYGNNVQEENTYSCHESAIYHLQVNKECNLLLTSR